MLQPVATAAALVAPCPPRRARCGPGGSGRAVACVPQARLPLLPGWRAEAPRLSGPQSRAARWRRRRHACCGAVARGPGEGGETPGGGSRPEARPRAVSALSAGRDVKRLVKNAFLVLSFLLWYGGNISFNIYNKQLLRSFAHPATVSTLYLGVGAVLGWLSWRLGLVRQPAFSRAQLVACLPLAVCHALTNTLMLTSLHAVAVSLSHTIRATEPLFVTAAAYAVLQTRPSAPLVWSLVPIVVGVSVASATDVSFSWVGCAAALGSNLASTARNVYSKQVMSGVRGNIDSVSLLTVVNALAFAMLLPFTAALDGASLAKMGWEGVAPVAGLALGSAVLLQLYQQVSYNILSKVSAVTHSVANCVKRVVVIVAAVIFFRHPVSPLNGIGTALALGGVFLYSSVKVREKGEQARWKGLNRDAREAWAEAEAAAKLLHGQGGTQPAHAGGHTALGAGDGRGSAVVPVA